VNMVSISVRRIGLVKTVGEVETASCIRRLQDAGCAEIKLLDRTASDIRIPSLQTGDVVVVDSLDHLGPPLSRVVEHVLTLLDTGASVLILNPAMQITPYVADQRSGVFRAICSCLTIWKQQRAQTRRRTMGLRNARAGRRPKLALGDHDQVLALLNAPGANVPDVARALNVGRTTLYRYLREVHRSSVEGDTTTGPHQNHGRARAAQT